MSHADEIVFEMSAQSEGTPSVFTKKDWLSILDNQNQSYQGNQSVIDTSQLANSNKFINYREGYCTIPLLITATSDARATFVAGTDQPNSLALPNTPGQSLDYAIGLKNWYGSIVHSFTVDYNGTTIIQQTPYIGMWNSFRLMTSLSVDDLKTQGATIGFFPDTATSAGVVGAANTSAGLAYTTSNCNNSPLTANTLVAAFNQGTTFNSGLLQRQIAMAQDPDGIAGGISQAFFQLQSKTAYTAPAAYVGTSKANAELSSNTVGNSAANWELLWKSYVFQKRNPTFTSSNADPSLLATYTACSIWQCAVTAQVYLKHLHPFFERIPLLKGVFMKLTLNLNQSSVTFTTTPAAITGGPQEVVFSNVSVQSPLGGVSPIMLASGDSTVLGGLTTFNGGCTWGKGNNIVSLSVGRTCLNTTQTGLPGGGNIKNSPLSGSILLNVPAYSFNPVFESSYLSSPVKKIVYSDVYQYQVLKVGAGAVFNNLVTNGIANIKSVLVLPFYSASGTLFEGNGGLIPFQSPFDPAGGGPTSPQCLMTQFNIQISGQNAIYNTERYEYEQFLNQFKGVNAQNGGQEDGATSGLVGQADFDSEYCYYYVNCGRMLPVEEAVPKSVNILGTNTSGKDVDLYVFVEYGVEVSVDILTGARV